MPVAVGLRLMISQLVVDAIGADQRK
jgi:hypothetical protein